MRLALLLAPALWLSAQTPPPAIARGVVLECDTASASGEFSLRTPTNQVLRFTFDAKTYCEREQKPIPASGLRPGDRIEVVAEGAAGPRYARTVHVLDLPAAAPPPPNRFRAYRSPIEHLAPQGNLTFSGVLQKVTPDRVVLRLKDGADQTILLRADTRFLVDGDIAQLRNFHPNMRVYIRAGKDLYGEVEAFQIVYGRILQPEAR